MALVCFEKIAKIMASQASPMYPGAVAVDANYQATSTQSAQKREQYRKVGTGYGDYRQEIDARTCRRLPLQGHPPFQAGTVAADRHVEFANKLMEEVRKYRA